MHMAAEVGIHELYARDSIAADDLLWGRRTCGLTRRGFLRNGGLAAMGAVLGGRLVFAANFPAGMIPAALAASTEPFRIPGKDAGLLVLNDRPWNAETPPHLLDDEVTTAERLFVRNNGLVPESVDSASWTLTLNGESAVNEKTFTIAQLKKQFTHYTYQLTLECGGNGRHEFQPPASGNQWTTGAVGCPRWTGVRLRDVLESAGVSESAVYIGYYGEDRHLSGEPGKVSISRGVPMRKALEDEAIIAWALNGSDLPLMNGYPLRLVFGGWPGSTSGKWLSRIAIRDRVHDGPKMAGPSYRVPCEPVAPGTIVPDEAMCIIEAMPVKSLITFPKTGAVINSGRVLNLRGHAWAGDLAVSSMHLSIDFGATWRKCSLKPPANRNAWQRWHSELGFPEKGYYEVWARATDSEGRQQPVVVPGWNPKGYLNNACHRIAVRVV
jgi:sulfite oxidase